MKDYLIKNKKNIAVGVFIFLIVAAFYLTIGCPIRFLTGVSCFGCGMTRALFSCLQFDFLTAHEMHPMIFTMPFVAFAFIFRNKLPRGLRMVLSVLFFTSMTVTYFYRMFTGSEVVYFAPQTGAIYKAIETIKNLSTGGI